MTVKKYLCIFLAEIPHSIYKNMNEAIRHFIQKVNERNIGEPEFLQAVSEVAESLIPYIESQSQYKKVKF